MADSLAPSGLAINQLLKLKAKGLISTQQFLEMTADLEGSVEERPIDLAAWGLTQDCNYWNILNSGLWPLARRLQLLEYIVR